MKKLNDVIYNKLLLQAEEATSQEMHKLAKAVKGSLTASPEDESVNYAIGEMNNDIYAGLWKLATCVMKYYNVESADVEKVNEVIESLASRFVSEVETSLNVESSSVGPLEPKLPGQE